MKNYRVPKHSTPYRKGENVFLKNYVEMKAI
jgi:hypothetical protein